MPPQAATYPEPARDVPVIAEYDVVVAGGGPAGCAAAVGAAREGARTLLAEREGFLGGAATLGLICRFMSPNGRDYQGVWHDFVRALRDLGGVRVATEDNCHGAFDPEMIKYAWDELLTRAGAEQLLHCHVAGAMKEGDAVTGIVVEVKSGRRAIRAGRVIDCTGDGLVAAMAGLAFDLGDAQHPWAMACTAAGRLVQMRMPEGMSPQELRRRIRESSAEALARGDYSASSIVHGRVPRKAGTWYQRELPNHGGLTIGGMRILKVNPLDPFDLTRAEREARAELLQQAQFYRRHVPGCETCLLVQTAGHIGVRSSRRIRGIDTMTAGDVIGLRKSENSIARGAWHVDVWPATDYTRPTIDRDRPDLAAMEERLKGGDYYDIRYGCVVAEGVENLLMAGRCLSAEHEAQASLRIQQTCMATGEAAGLAAALSLEQGAPPHRLDPQDVAAALKARREQIEPAFPNLSAV